MKKTTVEHHEDDVISVGRRTNLYIPDDFDMKIKRLDTLLALANACSNGRDISVFAWMCNFMDKKNMVTVDSEIMISSIGEDENGRHVSRRTFYRIFERMIEAKLIVRLSDGSRRGVREFMINPHLVLNHKSSDKEQYFYNRLLWDGYTKPVHS